jgi:hypothetical protein
MFNGLPTRNRVVIGAVNGITVWRSRIYLKVL